MSWANVSVPGLTMPPTPTMSIGTAFDAFGGLMLFPADQRALSQQSTRRGFNTQGGWVGHGGQTLNCGIHKWAYRGVLAMQLATARSPAGAAASPVALTAEEQVACMNNTSLLYGPCATAPYPCRYRGYLGQNQLSVSTAGIEGDVNNNPALCSTESPMVRINCSRQCRWHGHSVALCYRVTVNSITFDCVSRGRRAE